MKLSLSLPFHACRGCTLFDPNEILKQIHHMSQLVHYLFVNRHLVNEYADQLGIQNERSISKITSKVSVSFTGPKLESNREYLYGDPPIHEKITKLTNKLHKAGLIKNGRPPSVDTYRGTWSTHDFRFEKVLATKVVFPRCATEEVPALKELAVWVAEPDSSELSTEKWKFRGTFLLLPQANFDDVPFSTVHSGCSALQAVMNGYAGKPILLGEKGEPLGRGSFEHPVEKLRQKGGIPSMPQRISVLYRVRYMTDEQCYTFEGKTFRVCDLLGYPIFIAAI